MKNKNGITIFEEKAKTRKVKYVELRRKIDEVIVTPYHKKYIEELKKEKWYIANSFYIKEKVKK